MTALALHDNHVGPVDSYDQCPSGSQCAHCAAGRPAAPVEAGDPRELTSSTWELDDVVRAALPPAYHRPAWIDTCTPKGWFCACCWDEAMLSQWPCTVASRHGNYLARSWKFEEDQARLHRLTVAAVHDKLT